MTAPSFLLIALGSNRYHGRYGAPKDVLHAAVDAMAARGIRPKRLSRIHHTAPVGPGSRRFANGVLLAETTLSPIKLLSNLKKIERDFGRRRGRPWGDRVLDLDILALGGKAHRHGGLTIPHMALHQRRFVLDPLVEVAPDWRHPVLHLTARQLRFRLTSRRVASISRAEGP